MALGPAVQDGLGVVAHVERDVLAFAGCQLAALIVRVACRKMKSPLGSRMGPWLLIDSNFSGSHNGSIEKYLF